MSRKKIVVTRNSRGKQITITGSLGGSPNLKAILDAANQGLLNGPGASKVVEAIVRKDQKPVEIRSRFW